MPDLVQQVPFKRLITLRMVFPEKVDDVPASTIDIRRGEQVFSLANCARAIPANTPSAADRVLHDQDRQSIVGFRRPAPAIGGKLWAADECLVDVQERDVLPLRD